jgi:hypothetical protein
MTAAAAAGNSSALQPGGGVPSRLLGADARTLSTGQPIERATAMLFGRPSCWRSLPSAKAGRTASPDSRTGPRSPQAEADAVFGDV